jgi:hypothetical protein
VEGEIVGGDVDRLALTKIRDLRDQEIVLQGGGLVEVGSRAFLQRKVGQIAIIVIEGQHRSA